MSTYGQIYFPEKEEDIPLNTLYTKLPYKLQETLIKWKLPIRFDSITTWGVQGEKIQLPMTYSMYRKMSVGTRKTVFKKIEKKLTQKDITHVILPKTIKPSPFENIKECNGGHIKPFFIMDMIRFLTNNKMVIKELRDVEVIILDGNQKEVDMMIELIYPHVNYLTIATNNPERFEEKIDEVFEDVGLNIQISSYNKPTISQGDIIIDTHYDNPKVIQYCKSSAAYIDFGNHIEKTITLLERQSMVNVISEFSLMYNQESLDTMRAELILSLKRILGRNYKETRDTISKEKINVSGIQVDKL